MLLEMIYIIPTTGNILCILKNKTLDVL